MALLLWRIRKCNCFCLNDRPALHQIAECVPIFDLIYLHPWYFAVKWVNIYSQFNCFENNAEIGRLSANPLGLKPLGDD